MSDARSLDAPHPDAFPHANDAPPHAPASAPVYQPTETVIVDDRVVSCDGGSGGLGHPRVWLRIVHDSKLCPYCSRLYVLAAGAGDSDAH